MVDAAGSPGERIFFAAMSFGLLIAQAALISSGNVRRHRQLGQYGALLAAVIVVLGIYGGLIAAGRPGAGADLPGACPHAGVAPSRAAAAAVAGAAAGRHLARPVGAAGHA
jgi:hypothetical protein